MRPKNLMFHSLFSVCVLIGLLCLPPAIANSLAQAPCPEGEECEPNNRFGDANVIGAPGNVQGRISPAGDADWYAFSLASAGELRVTVSQVAPELDVWLRVWNSNKDTVSDWFRPPAEGGDTTGTLDIPASGRYYLELAAGDGSAASDRPYTLQIGFAPAVDSFEPNDTFGLATALELGTVYQASIFPLGDTDWYRLEVDHRGELEVAITDVPSELDMSFRVWSGDKDSISDWFTPLARGGNTVGRLDLPMAGSYLLEVADGSYDARSTAPYSVKITFTRTIDDDEPNDLFRDATALRFNQPHIATILPQGDVDWYRVDVDHPGELQVAATGVPAEMDVDFRIWNANRDTISDWFAPLAKGGDTVGYLDLPAPGAYFVEMADGQSDARSIQPFSVTAVFTPTADPFEPNDSFGAATVLQLDTPVQTNILPQGDADWHFVKVPHQGQLTVTTGDVPPELAVAIRIWNGNKDTISDWFLPLARGGNTTATVDVPSAGRYYLELADNENRGRSVRPFTLTVTFAATADQGEPNDSWEAATSVALDSSVAANILPVGDRDWYAFDIARPGQLHVLVTRVAPELDISCRLWDSQQAVIHDWFGPLARGGDTTVEIEIVEPGRYYLEVADGSDDARSIQPYLLYLSMAPIDPARVTVPVVVTPTAVLTATTALTATAGQTTSQ